MSAYVCFCEHPQSQHKRGRDGCRAVDCGCAKFQADVKASAALQGVTQATVPAEDATVVPFGDGGVVSGGQTAVVGDLNPLPTSALLRQAERERDECRRDLSSAVRQLHELLAERDLALAELASARTELEQLRRAFNPNTEGAPPA